MRVKTQTQNFKASLSGAVSSQAKLERDFYFMGTTLNKQQLAFVLDIKADDARAKMCVAWAKSLGTANKASRNAKGKVTDDYPDEMPISILSEGLNLPTLQESVTDIELNYLKRPASRKWILNDYPENQTRLLNEKGKRFNHKIPAGLKSLLSEETQKEIQAYWIEHFWQKK